MATKRNTLAQDDIDTLARLVGPFMEGEQDISQLHAFADKLLIKLEKWAIYKQENRRNSSSGVSLMVNATYFLSCT